MPDLSPVQPISKPEMQEGLIREVLRGHNEAVDFCLKFFEFTQIWDDLHDADVPMSIERKHRGLWLIGVMIPEDKFFNEHFGTLQPLVRAYFNDWMDSNVLAATGDPHQQSIAFVLRDSVGALLIECCRIVGGYTWMRRVSAKIRMEIHDETLEAYMNQLAGSRYEP